MARLAKAAFRCATTSFLSRCIRALPGNVFVRQVGDNHGGDVRFTVTFSFSGSIRFGIPIGQIMG
jgi:hypothetical protein